MAGQDASRYQRGRGLPPYLLSRNYADSSTDSDGASRIFATSSCSMTSDKGSDCSSVSHMPHTFSYMSTSSSFTWSDTTSISTAPSTFEYQTSNVSRLTDDETRTFRSEVLSMDEKNLSSYYGTCSGNKASSASTETTLSRNSFMDDVYTGPFFLTKSNDYGTNITSEWDYNSVPVSRPEDMFTPYVSILSNTDNEPHYERKRIIWFVLIITLS